MKRKYDEGFVSASVKKELKYFHCCLHQGVYTCQRYLFEGKTVWEHTAAHGKQGKGHDIKECKVEVEIHFTRLHSLRKWYSRCYWMVLHRIWIRTIQDTWHTGTTVDRRLHHIIRRNQILGLCVCVCAFDFRLGNELSTCLIHFVFRLLPLVCAHTFIALMHFYKKIGRVFFVPLEQLTGVCWSVKMQWL